MLEQWDIEWASPNKVKLTKKTNWFTGEEPCPVIFCCGSANYDYVWHVEFPSSVGVVTVDDDPKCRSWNLHFSRKRAVVVDEMRRFVLNNMTRTEAKVQEEIRRQAEGVAMGVASESVAVSPDTMARDGDSVTAQLEKLAQLKQSGALSEEEFARAKAKVLALENS